MAQPLVSIIIPAYNAAPWLAETLESALAQTHAASEIIVVDDGSTDETPAVARRYARARLITQDNRGLSGARNTGIREARGTYIQFLDADDLISPDKVEHQVRLLETARPGSLATGRWGRFRQDPGKARFSSSPYWRDLTPQEYLARVARTGNSIPVHAWLLPRSLVERIGPFSDELRVMEDHEYFARAVLASSGIRFCAEGCSYYRSFHGPSLSRERQRSAAESMVRAVELVEARLRATGPSAESSQIVADYYQWLAFRLYPDHADLVRVVQERVRRLGGSSVRPSMGRGASALARIVGWKLVQRLRTWLWSKGIYLSKHEFISD